MMTINTKLMLEATLKPSSRLLLSRVATPLKCESLAFVSCSPISQSKVSLKCSTIDKIDTIVANVGHNNTNVKCVNGVTDDAVLPPARLNNLASPWLMLPPQVDEATGETLECFYSLADGQTLRLNRKISLKVPDTAKCIASTMGWLAYVDTKDCSLYLTNPYVDDIVELPSLEKLPYVLGVKRHPKTGDILRFKVRLHHISLTWDEHELDPYKMVEPKLMVYHIKNLALSWVDPRDEDCVAMALQGEDVRRLAYCPIAKKFNSDTRFDLLEDYSDCWIGLQEEEYWTPPSTNQIVYSYNKHLFYTLNTGYGIMAFDVQSDRGRRSKKVGQFPWESLNHELKREYYKNEESEVLKAIRKKCNQEYYLVTLENGDLLLIARHYQYRGERAIPAYKTIHFDVFRAGFPATLERLSTIGRRAIFIGHSQSFAVMAKDSPGVKPDCIYFTDDLKVRSYNHSKDHWGHDNGIFSIKDGSITPCFPYNDAEEEMKVPISAPLFWVAPFSKYLAAQHGIKDEKLSSEG